jgi:hypothetical protein
MALKGDDVAASWVKAARITAGAPAWVEALSRGLVSLPGFDLLEGIFRGTIAGGLAPVKVGRAGGYVTGRRSAVNGLWGEAFVRPGHAYVSRWSRRGGHI